MSRSEEIDHRANKDGDLKNFHGLLMRLDNGRLAHKLNE